MTERRPHWDDSLVEAVKTAMRENPWSAFAVIATVEDWQNDEHEQAMRELRADKAAIARVRKVCEDKYVGPPTEYGKGFEYGYNDALGMVERALDGTDVVH